MYIVDFFNVKKRVEVFDDGFIKFRLYLNFIFAISMAFTTPIVTTLKGNEFKDILWLIPFFSLVSIILLKYTELFVKKTTIQQIHKAIAFTVLVFILMPVVYLYSPFLATIYLSVIVVIDSLLWNTYSVFLTNYITKKDASLISKYQTTRIHVWADGALIGGIVSVCVMSSNNIFNTILVVSAIDIIIVGMFIYNYRYIKNINEDMYKIKEENE